MLEDRERINLSNLDGGALAELFEANLPRLLDNVKDPNTKPEALRQVSITLKVKPTKSRREAVITYGVNLKLAAANERSTTVFLAKDEAGEPCLKEYPQDKDIEDVIAEEKAKAREALAEAEAEPPADGGKVVNIGERS